MRIISGKYRGLVLSGFNGEQIRPTADRVKESLFNILADEIRGASALDLFCGSGSLGLECISRGADFVQFNDISKDSIAVLKKNLAKLKGESNFKITEYGYSECLSRLGEKFSLIFIDPPYADDSGVHALEIIARNKLLTNGGVAVYERDRSFSGEVEGLQKYDERKYGKTFITFFKYL